MLICSVTITHLIQQKLCENIVSPSSKTKFKEKLLTSYVIKKYSVIFKSNEIGYAKTICRHNNV